MLPLKFRTLKTVIDLEYVHFLRASKRVPLTL